MMGWNDGWGVGSWLGMGLGMVLFWGLVIVAIVAILRATTDGRRQDRDQQYQRPATGTSAALQTLDERFARGDISAEEYRQRRDVLQGQ